MIKLLYNFGFSISSNEYGLAVYYNHEEIINYFNDIGIIPNESSLNYSYLNKNLSLYNQLKNRTDIKYGYN